MNVRAALAVGPFYIGKPSLSDRQAMEKRIPNLPSNFPFLGITRENTGLEQRKELKGWAVDRTRARVGTGQAEYKQAMNAINTWENFSLDWFFVSNNPPVKIDAPVVVAAQTLFLWSVLPLRVNWIENDGPPKDPVQKQTVKRRMAFGHVTLEGHQLAGEESFAVEWLKNDEVWYEVLTVSKPASLLSVLSQPMLRFFQLKFMGESIDAVKKATTAGRKKK